MPNDHPETLSDICARIRTIDESMMRDLDFMAVFLEFLPKDIEAAAEREQQDAMKTALLAKCKVCEKVGPASAHGNAAALREALRDIRQYVRVWIGTDVIDRTMAERIVATCDAALSAPARNCDRFQTADEARDAVKAEFANTMLLDDRQLRAVCDWLFSPRKKETDNG